MCMTGGAQPWGLEFGLYGGIDRTDEDIIGAIDAPDNIPAGGFEFIDNPIMTGVYAQTVRRYLTPNAAVSGRGAATPEAKDGGCNASA
jgi:hypothetical protein